MSFMSKCASVMHKLAGDRATTMNALDSPLTENQVPFA